MLSLIPRSYYAHLIIVHFEFGKVYRRRVILVPSGVIDLRAECNTRKSQNACILRSAREVAGCEFNSWKRSSSMNYASRLLGNLLSRQ